jgi:hypothetical protein
MTIYKTGLVDETRGNAIGSARDVGRLFRGLGDGLGTTAVVGAYGTNSNQGATYILKA